MGVLGLQEWVMRLRIRARNGVAAAMTGNDATCTACRQSSRAFEVAQRDLYGIKEAHEAVRHGPMTRVGGIRGGGGEMQGERSRTVDFYFGRRVTCRATRDEPQVRTIPD